MTDYRRAQFEGGYYFFTVVTYERRPFLIDDLARKCLRCAWRQTRQERPFEVVALCLLPDHLHSIWRLPEADRDFSGRWSRIKAGFTRLYLAEGGQELAQTQSRLTRRERGVWQRRFWEHQIRDESDLQRHVDYIHYNPVKHGLVEAVEDWPWSTYHRYARENDYPNRNWDDIERQIADMVAGE